MFDSENVCIFIQLQQKIGGKFPILW